LLGRCCPCIPSACPTRQHSLAPPGSVLQFISYTAYPTISVERKGAKLVQIGADHREFAFSLRTDWHLPSTLPIAVAAALFASLPWDFCLSYLRSCELQALLPLVPLPLPLSLPALPLPWPACASRTNPRDDGRRHRRAYKFRRQTASFWEAGASTSKTRIQQSKSRPPDICIPPPPTACSSILRLTEDQPVERGTARRLTHRRRNTNLAPGPNTHRPSIHNPQTLQRPSTGWDRSSLFWKQQHFEKSIGQIGLAAIRPLFLLRNEGAPPVLRPPFAAAAGERIIPRRARCQVALGDSSNTPDGSNGRNASRPSTSRPCHPFQPPVCRATAAPQQPSNPQTPRQLNRAPAGVCHPSHAY